MTPFSAQLKTLLIQDLEDLKQLTEVLDTESKSFSKSNTDEFKSLLASKNRLITQIEQRAKLKAKLMGESGLGMRPGKVEQTLLTIPDEQLHILWKAVSEQLRFCKERNEVNGKIAAHSLSRVGKMMLILRGQQNTPNLYGAKGGHSSLNTSRAIAQA